jgi:hypothetical protein
MRLFASGLLIILLGGALPRQHGQGFSASCGAGVARRAPTVAAALTSLGSLAEQLGTPGEPEAYARQLVPQAQAGAETFTQAARAARATALDQATSAGLSAALQLGRACTPDAQELVRAANALSEAGSLLRYHAEVDRALVDLLATEPGALFGPVTAAEQPGEFALRAHALERLLHGQRARLEAITPPEVLAAEQDAWSADLAAAAEQLTRAAGGSAGPADAQAAAADAVAVVEQLRTRVVTDESAIWQQQHAQLVELLGVGPGS